MVNPILRMKNKVDKPPNALKKINPAICGVLFLFNVERQILITVLPTQSPHSKFKIQNNYTLTALLTSAAASLSKIAD